MSSSTLRRTPQIVDSILELVGATPLVRLPRAFFPELEAEFLLKVESLNPGGSVKDRIGKRMLLQAVERGDLRPGGTVVECTSGNTGAGLCMAAAALGYRSIIVIPDKMSQEKIDLLRAYGAEVVVVPSNVPSGHPQHYTRVAARIARETPGAWWADQFHNPDNPDAHFESTGPELWEQCEGRLDAFVAGCGTGGTLTGTARYLRERDPRIRCVGVDPPGSVYAHYWKTGELGEAGPYAVEGVGEDEIPGTWDPSVISDYEVVADSDSFAMTRRLARETGIFVGGSSGMVLVAAARVARRLASGARIVVLLPDSGDRYLSKVYNRDWLRDGRFLPPVPAATATVAELLRDRPAGAVKPEDDLLTAWKQLGERGIRPLPVQAEERGPLLGVVDEAGLVERLASGQALERHTVGELLLPPPPTLASSAPWREALRVLADQECILVEQDGNYLAFDRHDLIRALPRLEHA